MPSKAPWVVKVKDHPGSSAQEIDDEPDWSSGHTHRIGFKNRDDRVPGVTHKRNDYSEEIKRAKEQLRQLREEAKGGKLVNFRDLIESQEDFHLRHPENRSVGWRYVLNATEDWVKYKQDWPLNIKKREAEEKKKQEEEEKKKSADQKAKSDGEKQEEEHEWRRSQGESNRTHHDAYARGEGDEKKEQEDKDQKGDGSDSKESSLKNKYSAVELALLKCLQNEKDYIANLGINDGKGSSPQKGSRPLISIDEQDQFSPDNWLPRSPDLIRLTGKHPLNAEAPLTRLLDAGLITPNELHYVRNHGAVPRLMWEFHEIEIQCGKRKTTLSMEDLKTRFPTINIPIALACDGNRRKELNMIRMSKGFNWGAGGVSCAYWKGPLLRDVLRSAGVPEKLPDGARFWVNFEGSDELSDGKYATCIPFDYAMDPANDVMLAYEMNDVPLPPDHGYPVRIMIPGYVGGRCVKWLRRIWVSDKENDSHYHIWDNRVLPAFVTDKDGEFANTLFNHPSTACNEQNLNSVILRPAQGEKIPVAEARKGRSYRIAGYAYDGGGHEVQRVEVSLDGGKTWLYCIRKFPDRPIRHGNKFWTWLHWHVDVEMSHLLRAESITVRCFNVFKNTQPQQHNWNIMGMMNNCWYVVRPEITYNDDSDVPCIMFRHPVEPATGDGGWMQPSEENKIAQAKQEAGAPQKQFTREEIEKHDNEKDCWIVVEGKVYDATSVLSWHPGGKAAILGHAGKVHQATTDEFASIHDSYAYQKLKECILGTVTEKAAHYIKKCAEDAAKEAASSKPGDENIAFQKHRWVPVKLLKREAISNDSRSYTFQLPEGKTVLGLGTCQHVQLGFHMKDKMLIRSYTPTRPLLPVLENGSQGPKSSNSNGDRNGHGKGNKKIDNNSDKDTSIRDGDGTFQLTIKTYFPDANQPGGALSNILDSMPIGEEVELRGPTGDIVYQGNGVFIIEGKKRTFSKVSLVLGGSGITPGFALIARILLAGRDNDNNNSSSRSSISNGNSKRQSNGNSNGKDSRNGDQAGKATDKTQIRVVDANKTEGDILLREELDKFERESDGQLKITHILSAPDDKWKGLKGYVDKDVLRGNLFPPGEDSVALLCGPPAMIQKGAQPALKDWGYVEDENMFGF